MSAERHSSNPHADLLRRMPVHVPGVGTMPYGEMTPEHHRRYHAEIANTTLRRVDSWLARTEPKRRVVAARA